MLAGFVDSRLGSILFSKFCGLVCLTLASTALPAAAYAEDIAIVVNLDNRNPIDINQTIQLYLHKTSAFADNSNAEPLHLAADQALYKQFCLELLNMTPSQYKSYWSRLLFTGSAHQPTAFASQQQLLDYIKTQTDAIGYVSTSADLSGVKVVAILKNGQWQAQSW